MPVVANWIRTKSFLSFSRRERGVSQPSALFEIIGLIEIMKCQKRMTHILVPLSNNIFGLFALRWSVQRTIRAPKLADAKL
jgi:hypothetical protein